jgi:hypothetical protein
MDNNTLISKRELLKKLGVTHPGDKIYLALLKLRRATVAELARETGCYRPLIYKELPHLISRRLISKVPVGKRIMYIAENPLVLQALVDRLREEVDLTIPELSQMYEGSHNKPVVRYVEGCKAIQKIYEDIVRRAKKGDSYYRYESIRDYKENGKYYPALYRHKATGNQNVLDRYLITNEEGSLHRPLRINRFVKTIPSSYDAFDHNITQVIFKDTVAFIDFDTETATIIENKRFADFQLKIYKMLFGKL